MASDLLSSLFFFFVAVEIGFLSPFSHGHGFATFLSCPDSLLFSPSTCYLVVVLFLFKAAYPIVQLVFSVVFFVAYSFLPPCWLDLFTFLLTFHAIMCRNRLHRNIGMTTVSSTESRYSTIFLLPTLSHLLLTGMCVGNIVFTSGWSAVICADLGRDYSAIYTFFLFFDHLYLSSPREILLRLAYCLLHAQRPFLTRFRVGNLMTWYRYLKTRPKDVNFGMFHVPVGINIKMNED